VSQKMPQNAYPMLSPPALPMKNRDMCREILRIPAISKNSDLPDKILFFKNYFFPNIQLRGVGLVLSDKGRANIITKNDKISTFLKP
jgi:hypothetical protein